MCQREEDNRAGSAGRKRAESRVQQARRKDLFTLGNSLPVDSRSRICPSCPVDSRSRICPSCPVDSRSRICPSCAVDSRSRIFPSCAVDSRSRIRPSCAVDSRSRIRPSCTVDSGSRICSGGQGGVNRSDTPSTATASRLLCIMPVGPYRSQYAA